MRPGKGRACAAVASALLVTACVAPTRPAPVGPSQAEWDHARVELARLRSELPQRPYTQPIHVSLREPITGKRFDGRGAVGVDPGHAMRMILIGPGGGTALDVWVTRDAWRMVVPAISFVKRGGVEAPASTPIGFFRAWFVDPLGGRLLAIGPTGSLVLRDDSGGTTELEIVSRPGLFAGVGRRRSGTATERFTWEPRADGGKASYRHLGSGLRVAVELGPPQSEPPDAAAFADPDGAQR